MAGMLQIITHRLVLYLVVNVFLTCRCVAVAEHLSGAEKG